MQNRSDLAGAGAGRMARWGLAAVGLVAAVLLVGQRYQFTPSTIQGRAYRLDRLSGKVTAMVPQSERPSVVYSVDGDIDTEHRAALRRAIIDVTRQAGSFHSTCRPTLMAVLDKAVLQGWRVYAIADDRPVLWDRATPEELSTGTYLARYAYVLHQDGIPQDTLGWYWEVRLKEGAVRRISGDPALERKYGVSVGSSAAPARTAAKRPAQRRVSAYVSLDGGKAYHLPDCRWVADVGPDSLVHFDSVRQAEAAGLRPCRTCTPGR